MTKPLQESIQVFFRTTPLQLAQGCNTRHHLPFHLRTVFRPFRPNTTLHANDTVFLFSSKGFVDRFKVINPCHTGNSCQTVISRIAEIQMTDRTNDCLKTGLCRANAGLHASPCHHSRTSGRISIQNFIPSQHLPSPFDDLFFYFAHEISLKLILFRMLRRILQSQFLNLCLAFRAFLPFQLRTLISSDMNIRRWEDIHNFIDHIFGKLQSRLITATQYFIKDTKLRSRFIRTSRATQLRIGSQSRQHVSRHIDLRYHRNKTIGSILYNLPSFFLRIKSTHRNTVVFVGTRSRDRFLPMRTNLRQFRVFLDLNTPALVFRQVPMKVIDMVHSQHINDFLQIIYREKVASYIHHKPSVVKTRIILNRSCRNSSQRLSIRDWERLVNRLDTIKDTGFGRTFHRYAICRNQ